MRKLVSPWAPHLEGFHRYKQLCGYKYEKSESVLFMFDRYYASLDIKELKFSRDIVEPFLYLKEGERIGTQLWKATILRQFGKYLFLNDIINHIYIIPPISKKGEKEYLPYIYSKKELIDINAYIENYKTPSIPGGFRECPNTINAVSTCIKILMSTGMRLGEVLNLKMNEVDFNENLIYISIAKNDNKRIVPISETLKKDILLYIERTPFPINHDDYLLFIDKNNRLKESNVDVYFYMALKHCGIRREKHRGPRIHDFRHTFAVMSLTQMHKAEDDINLSLTYLSTYLGHKSFNETQKYIWMCPMLFNDIKNRMSEYSSFIMDIFGGEKFDED